MKARDAAELAGLIEELTRLLAADQRHLALARNTGASHSTVAYWDGQAQGVAMCIAQLTAFLDSQRQR